MPILTRGTLIMLTMILAAPCAPADDRAVCNQPRKTANLHFTLTDVAGRAVNLEEFESRVILINFWATWCAPCKQEIPWLIDLHHRYQQRGLTVLGVSVDEAIAGVGPFAAELRMDYPVLIGAGADEFKESFGPLLGFPTSVLIARDRVVCMRFTGIATREDLERGIRALL